MELVASVHVDPNLRLIDARHTRSTPPHPSGMLAAMTRATHTFVGRGREIDTLRDSVLDATAGRGGLWLVTGEPGIGKSRLIEEVARVAADHDVQVLWGRCWEAGGAPAYWPWIQVLRSVLERSAADATQLDPAQVDALVALMPELRDGAPRVSQAPALEPEQARFRWMDTVTRVLRSAAQATPLLLLLEDLHAADPSTLLLLSFVSRQCRDARVLVIGTLRDAEAQRGETRALFDRLAADGQHLPLSRLPREDVSAYLSRMIDRAPDPALVQSVFALTEGNPLFVGELTRFLQRAGTHTMPQSTGLPPGIRATIRARLAQLTAPTRRVLEMAAVIGRECRRTTLRALTEDAGLGPELDRALDEACTAEVLLEVAPGVLRFSHVLLQQVLVGDLDDARLRSLHAAVAHELTEEGARASERAHHWLAAGDEHAAEGAQAAVDAAREAEMQHALSETAHWYGRALEAKTRARATRAERCEILLSLGHAQIAAHEIDEGRKSCVAAAGLARELGDAERLARAALAFGAVYTIGDVVQALVALLQEALVALPVADSSLRARVMARLAAALQPAPEPEVPIAMARDAIAMARRVNDPRTLLSTIVAGCSAMMDLGDPAECRELQREHVMLARQLGEPAEEFRGQLRLVFSSYELGDHLTWRNAIAGCTELGTRLRQPHYGWRVAALQTMVAMAEGRFAAAAAAMEDAKVLGEQAGDPNVARTCASQRLTWLRLQGRFDQLPEAIALLERVSPQVPALRGMLSAYVGGQLAAAGDREGARARHAELGSERDFMTKDSTLFDAVADLALAAGDTPMMQALYAAALPRTSRWSTGGLFGFTLDQPVERNLGRLAAGLGRVSEALVHYEGALTLLRQSGLRGLHAWTAHEAADIARVAEQPSREAAWREEASQLATASGITLRVEPAWTTPVKPIDGAIERAVSAVPSVAFFSMVQEGDTWRLDCDGRAVHVKDNKGIALLARLVARAGDELHVLDLVSSDGGIDRGDAGELLDAQARAAYQARVHELRETLEDAEQRGDVGHAERAQEELSQIAQELARGIGLGGQSRRSNNAAERARINVQRRLRDAISKIAAHDPDLGRHLEWAIKTGTYCSYLRK